MSKPTMFSKKIEPNFDNIANLSYDELIELSLTAYKISYEYGLLVANRIREFENE